MTCPRCDDTGLVEYVGGEHHLAGNTYTGGRTVTATPEKPVYKRCGCRADRPTIIEREF